MWGKLHQICMKTDGFHAKIRCNLNGMNTVNLSVECKFIFAFSPENICVSIKSSVSSCRLPISLHKSIAQYHKRSSVVNVPSPHEHEPELIEK